MCVQNFHQSSKVIHFICKYFSWTKYYDERKPVDKHALKLSHFGETFISAVFSVAKTKEIAYVISF